jgi:hypothetical protein
MGSNININFDWRDAREGRAESIKLKALGG